MVMIYYVFIIAVYYAIMAMIDEVFMVISL